MSRWIDGDWLLNFFEPYPDDYQTPLGTLRACVDDAPSIEPKQGEWIETSEGTVCGNCHKFPFDDGEYHIVNWHSDFCPNCGARMI